MIYTPEMLEHDEDNTYLEFPWPQQTIFWFSQCVLTNYETSKEMLICHILLILLTKCASAFTHLNGLWQWLVKLSRNTSTAHSIFQHQHLVECRSMCYDCTTTKHIKAKLIQRKFASKQIWNTILYLVSLFKGNVYKSFILLMALDYFLEIQTM